MVCSDRTGHLHHRMPFQEHAHIPGRHARATWSVCYALPDSSAPLYMHSISNPHLSGLQRLSTSSWTTTWSKGTPTSCSAESSQLRARATAIGDIWYGGCNIRLTHGAQDRGKYCEALKECDFYAQWTNQGPRRTVRTHMEGKDPTLQIDTYI